MHNLTPWCFVVGGASYNSHFVAAHTTLCQNPKGAHTLEKVGDSCYKQ